MDFHAEFVYSMELQNICVEKNLTFIYMSVKDLISTLWFRTYNPCYIIIFILSAPSAVYASMTWVSIGSGNGLSPVRRQAITWTNAKLLFIGPLGTHFIEIWIKMQNFRFNEMHLKR